MTRPPDLITEASQLEELIRKVEGMPLLALDLETDGLDPLTNRVLLLQIGDDRMQYVVDCRKVPPTALRPILSGSKPKVLHNAKFDYKFLKSAFGIETENMLDTMLTEQVLCNGKAHSGFGLADVAQKYLGMDLPKEERKTFVGHRGDFSRSQLDYARLDVAVTYRVLLEQMPLLRSEGLEQTGKLECLAAGAFGDMELAGVHLDIEKWKKLLVEAEAERDLAKSELDRVLGPVADRDLFGNVQINYDSEEQVRAAFAALGIEIEDTREWRLKNVDHEAAGWLLKYREQQKVVTAYGESFLSHIHPTTGRIHPEFRQIGAESGRVSCTNPNLQNIKKDNRFRECFTAPPGRKIVTADYSGCELRIIAEASQDPIFLRTFREGGDLHSIVARAMFGKPVSKTENPELRDCAKTINFGLAYGMSASGLAGVMNCPLDEAKRLLNSYFGKYPAIKSYLDSSGQEAVDRGYSTTFGGRKRYYRRPEDDDEEAKAAIRRKGKNTPIQGTNADMTKLALVWLRNRFRDRDLDAKVVNTVHDEIVVECSEEAADRTAELVRETMVEAGEQFIRSVPVEVDVEVADCWRK